MSVRSRVPPGYAPKVLLQPRPRDPAFGLLIGDAGSDEGTDQDSVSLRTANRDPKSV